MTLKPFTKNFADNSTEAGFQFTFFCDLCGDGFKTSFQASKTYKKGGLLRGLGKAVSVAHPSLARAKLDGQRKVEPT